MIPGHTIAKIEKAVAEAKGPMAMIPEALYTYEVAAAICEFVGKNYKDLVGISKKVTFYNHPYIQATLTILK